MNVLIIPEDFNKDQYILQPIITAMFEHLGKPKAKVRVCQDPRLGGISEALKWEQIAGIINRYKGMIDLFLLCVDRDGNETRKQKLEALEQKVTEELLAEGDRCFLAENAWQEIEVWALAGLDLPQDWKWQAVRGEIHPKETYFVPIVTQRSLLNSVGQGRKTLGTEAAKRYQRVRQLCPEDILALEDRIQSWIKNLDQ